MGLPFSKKQKKWRESLFHACPDCDGKGFRLINRPYSSFYRGPGLRRCDCRTCKGLGKVSDTDMAEHMARLLTKDCE